jgi:hypothetical protein
LPDTCKVYGLKEEFESDECYINAYQFDDYTKYEADRFDAPARKKIHDEQFPLDCQRAFDMGARFATR